ncbi:DNA gyrase/topoisomerase IV subunit A [Cytophaga hutchinsonii]|jgi:topoisomerase-4 subunit A|uniref:Topoisomerase IV subunit A n=1 Tax=Cytophaga hutchinsonii (strain ATCC 33406 / DSM 1761 / CIP 103989 / NBRC 15051 / NCIMB 9469 / D465) TaxID=269798 RepID=A0A6N4SRC8_CYTH3|nr:DNA gyrase/topoisomerase IV subunit A [Cytophaga hutchinsonii]ABG58908.1 topoisomerase IV subunit A [Cytophaga hutchinsonii ATCC 33406]SFX81817.1 topoisomerase-4 subunit A [Cytophaga hutchinsonii ATCC 33406]
MAKDINNNSSEEQSGNEHIHDVVHVNGLYENWFLEYASYVILERAVPHINDGLKPVQRRILHAMRVMDDGRFNKIANVIGSTMQYHPHGDASIGDAIVNMGQKDLLIEPQGNWGDIRTGDSAAAPRYIEGRLSKFALDVVFNEDTTEWQASYDGRKKEPVTLPVKFPLLLAQGVEGIAVGLSTKVLPHNFVELIEASIAVLKNKKFEIFPDFATGGFIDVSNYNEGQKGSRVRVRARIEDMDKKTLVIKDIPFGTTTTSLIESIVKANDTGKIKIKKVIDNTAKDVEIQVQLLPGTDPGITIDALYAFTECESSISPNACVIVDDKPHFLSVHEILRICTRQTVDLLKQELQIRRSELLERILFSSLEKIFIENRIYRKIEECETWEDVLLTIDKGLQPFKKQFYRTITTEDIVRLTEIKIKRISKFDSFKADELMRGYSNELKEVEHNLENIIDYSIAYYTGILKKYGKGRERKTEIKTFDVINATVVAANNQKLYINRAEGFIGFGLKKDEYICDCSDIDDVIVFRRDGICVVKKIGEKVFVGKDILYAGIFRKGDDRMVYNLISLDGASGNSMVKRFNVMGVTREKEYPLVKANKASKVLYFSANPNGEAETVSVTLTPTSKAKIKVFDFDFSTIEIKGRDTQGNILTKHPVKKVTFKAAGESTLAGTEIYYDETIGRINTDKKGLLIGSFASEDKILATYKDGTYEVTGFELTNRYDADQLLSIEKHNPEAIVSALYLDAPSKTYYIKRFKLETTTLGKRFAFIPDGKGNQVLFISTDDKPKIKIDFAKGKYVTNPTMIVSIDEFSEIKGWKSIGNKLGTNKINSISRLEAKKTAEKPKKDDGYVAGSTIELNFN